MPKRYSTIRYSNKFKKTSIKLQNLQETLAEAETSLNEVAMDGFRKDFGVSTTALINAVVQLKPGDQV